MSELSDNDLAVVMAAFEKWGGRSLTVQHGATHLSLTAPAMAPEASVITVRSPSVGHCKTMVETGQAVEKDMPLAVVDTLSKSFEVVAPASGEVRNMHVRGGDFVGYGDPLFEIVGAA